MWKTNEYETLLANLRNGDNATYENLVKVTISWLKSTAFSIVRNKADAEDAVAETYAELFTKCNKIRDAKTILAWLKTVVSNKSLNILKKNSRSATAKEKTLEYFVNLYKGSVPDPYETAQVMFYLTKLSDEEYRLLKFRYEGYSISKISRLMSLSYGKTQRLLVKVQEKYINFYKN